MADLLKGVQLNKNDLAESTEAAEDVLKDKVVGLYFAAEWSPPCRTFTPILKDFYQELQEGGEYEIVFVSLDHTESDLKRNLEYNQGEWYSIPFGHDQITGIPVLVVIKPDGTVITKDGCADVQTKSSKVCLSDWKNE